MKRILSLVILSIFLASCGSTKNTGKIPKPIIGNTNKKQVQKVTRHKKNHISAKATTDSSEEEEISESPKKAKNHIIEYAKTFQGTRYKFGGTTNAGMDCSGLVYTAFQKEHIDLPRISRDMATKGILVSFKDIEKGDLVFFKTSRKDVISHVGLVVEIKHGEVKFIHSTSHAGVIISSLEEKYWKNAFVEVRRII